MSGTTESEPTEPGEKGELAASKGEPPTANPYPADSVEADEWLDGTPTRPRRLSTRKHRLLRKVG